MRRLVVVVGAVAIIGSLGLLNRPSTGPFLAVSQASERPSGKQGTAEVAPSAKAIPVRLAAVERHALSHPIHATGQIRAKSQIDLGFLVGGEVAWVGADVGAKVRRGQVLARLDETQMAADAERARAAADQSRRDLDRVRHLEESGAVAKVALESAETGQAVSSAQQRSADFALRHGTLVAPEDGVIDVRLIERGQTVAPGQPAFRLSGRGRGAVIRASLADRDVVGLEVGRSAQVYLDALGDEDLPGKVSQIASAASLGSGGFEVEVRLDSPPRDYKSGMTAKIDIERKVTVGAIVPVSALVPGDRDGASVFAVRDGIAHRLPVHVLFIEDEVAALKEPLSEVKQVATLGAGMLAEGTAVQEVGL
jgi:RND family efflux transporter MFP subunit